MTQPHLVVFVLKHRSAFEGLVTLDPVCVTEDTTLCALSPSTPIGPAAVAKQRWQRRVALVARANACWEHRWSAQKERKSAEGGRRRVWELMLAADVCHSSLSVATHSLALYQARNRRSCCSLCASGADI